MVESRQMARHHHHVNMGEVLEWRGRTVTEGPKRGALAKI